MKKIKKLALPLIFLLHLYPVLHALAATVSGTFESTGPCLLYDKYPLAYAIIVFIATLLGAISRRQIMPEKGFGKACTPFLLPLALLNAMVAAMRENLAAMILVALSCICALIIFLPAPNRKWAKIVSFVFSGFFALFATVIFPITFFAYGIGTTTVVQEVKSPDGQYIAYLTDVNQGALGGDTRIEIMKKPIRTPFGRCTGYYYLDWDNWAGVGVLSEITFEWKDNDTLIYGNMEINIGE